MKFYKVNYTERKVSKNIYETSISAANLKKAYEQARQEFNRNTEYKVVSVKFDFQEGE